ncbi:hypothetical protein C356_01080 [Cryptococcus neoformans c45]|nr:hypothetical protein C356_01080 [Cryptococcus neoformans var. grubii c45]
MRSTICKMAQDIIQFKLSGGVQGVNFRYYTQKEAQKLGIRGHCYNHSDSSVQGVAVGSSEKVDQFRKWLEKGPPSAEVHNVELIKELRNASEADVEKAVGTSSGFEVRR